MVPSPPWPTRVWMPMVAGMAGAAADEEAEAAAGAAAREREEGLLITGREVTEEAATTALLAAPRFRGRSLALAAVAGSAALLLALVRRGPTGEEAGVDQAVELHRDTGLLHWGGYKHKCLDVQGGAAQPGTHVQIWTCHKDSENQHFIFPRKQGLIRWASHPGLCIQTAHGKLDNGNFLVLQHCNSDFVSMQWQMPAGAGPIRLLHHPTKCIDEHNLHRQKDGYDARLGSCPSSGDVPSDRLWKKSIFSVTGQMHWKPHNGKSCLHAIEPKAGSVVHVRDCNPFSIHTQFVFPGRFGMIRWAAHPEFCLHLPGGNTENGTEIQLWHCNEKFESQQWEMPDGLGPVRSRYQKDTCIKAVKLHGVARVHDCSPDEVEEMQWFVRPKITKWGYPSLYCVAIMQPWGYEHDIFTRQLNLATERQQDIGLFDCDQFNLFSKQAVTVGWHHRQGWVHTVVFPQAYVGVSKDGTAGNAELFMNMWDAVKSQGLYNQHDWTIKVDPDCVVIPDRLRGNLAPKTNGGATFIENCNAFPGSPDYPMTYGAIEVFSKAAMVRYFQGEWQCRQMDWHPLGEDVFMVRCLRSLGVVGQYDPSIVGDGLCGQAVCSIYKPAYHPFKSADAWMGCWNQAVR